MGRHGEGNYLRAALHEHDVRARVLALPAKGRRLLTDPLAAGEALAIATAVAIAREFRLGTPAAAPRRLPGLSRARVYALVTDRGEFVVKVSDADAQTLSLTSALERAAREAGVATPTPIDPVTPLAGYWGLVAGRPTRVSRAVRGAPPPLPATPELAGWLGHTVATIASLAVAVPPARSPAFAPWRDRLPRAYRQLAATLDELAALAAIAWAHPPPMRPGHRDITRANILLSAGGPLLLDFDQSGPAPPWWELVHQALLLSCIDLGAQEPDEVSVRAAVAAYADAGGPVGAADIAAFTGLITGLLSWVDERADRGHEASLAQAARSLPGLLRSLPTWPRLLT